MQTELTTGKIQNLAESISKLRDATAGQELKLVFRIELGSENASPPEEMVKKVNEQLKEVSPKLELK